MGYAEMKVVKPSRYVAYVRNEDGSRGRKIAEDDYEPEVCFQANMTDLPYEVVDRGPAKNEEGGDWN